MGLKARKIKTMIEEYSSLCTDDLNQKLGTNFSFEVNWEIIPSDIDDWNWSDEDLKKCYLANFIAPIEVCFNKLLKDDMYKEAINKQVKSVKFEPGPEGRADWSYEKGALTCKHTLTVNFSDVENSGSLYIENAAEALTQTIDGGLD